MNQEILLSTDSINAGGKKQAINSLSDTRNEGDQAFSSELDKHIEKQDPADKTTASDVKQSPSQDKQADNKSQQQAEGVENKNGNILPDEQITAENIEKLVVVDEETELGVELIGGVQHPAVVSQVKDNFTKAADAAVVDTNKKLEKLVSTEYVAVIKQNTDSSEQNKQQTETSKIRPDILQALSARSAGKDGESNSIKGDVKTLLTTEQFVDKKPAFKELQLTEIVKAIVSDKAQQNSQLVDKGSNTIATTLSNIATTTVTEPVSKPAIPSLDIQPTIQSKAWSRVLSGRVIWMAREGVQEAALKLNPANLGSIDVKLRMNDERVHVTFVAQHAATRDALEQALPRLRESFIENGLEFADADVLQHDSEQADNSQADNESVNSETGQSVLSDGVIDNEQQETSIEQDIEVGVSLYA